MKLPVVIHSRDAAKDTLDIMKEKKAQEIGDTMPDLYGCCHADTIEVCIDDTESIEIEEAWI